MRIDLDGSGVIGNALLQVSFYISGAATHVVGTSQTRLEYEGRIEVCYGAIEVSFLISLIAPVVVGSCGANSLRLRKGCNCEKDNQQEPGMLVVSLNVSKYRDRATLFCVPTQQR